MKSSVKLFKLNKLLATMALIVGCGTANMVFADWIITSNNHCKAYNDNPQPNETATWSGNCKDGYVQGYGTLQWYQNGKKSETYIGQYSQGKMSSKGIYTWADGEQYDGEWKDNKMHGKGVYTWADGSKYNGEYKDDKQNGKGVKIWGDGEYKDDKYDGEWKDDKMHGKGIYTWADGSKYNGEYKDDEMHGLGKLTLVKDNDSISSWQDDNKGFWQGDVYVVQGIFENDGLIVQCEPNKKACDKARLAQPKIK